MVGYRVENANELKLGVFPHDIEIDGRLVQIGDARNRLRPRPSSLRRCSSGRRRRCRLGHWRWLCCRPLHVL